MEISVIGTGMIAREVLAMLRKEDLGIGVSSIYAHQDKAKADELAGEYGIERVFTDYETLLREDKADFLYIAVVNTAHYPMAREALLAGRNVIVEKPMAMTAEEVKELMELASERGCWLFEAMTLLHLPNFGFVLRHLKDIGPVHAVIANYSQYSSRYDRYLQGDVAPAFNPDLGGGALRDLNVYNINAVVALFGSPKSQHYYPNTGHNGVDTSGMMVLNYDGFQAVCIAAKDCHGPSGMTIEGEKGYIQVTSPVNSFTGVELHVGSHVTKAPAQRYESRLTEEFIAFHDIYRQGDREAMNHYLLLSLAAQQVIG